MTKLLSIGLDDAVDSNIDTTVVVPTLLAATNGAPASGQFRSDISGRAAIPDLSNMLSVQMGPQRFMTQEIYQLQSEFGPAGQPVFGVVNDKFNQVRYVGSWSVFNDTFGSRINTSNIGDYAEIVFYGTGLNVLYLGAGDTRNIVASVDGGADSAGLLVGATYSNVIDSRNYASNHIVSATSGLSLGFHTVKIKLSVNNISLYGFEILTETSTLQITPGSVAKGKRKNTLTSLQSIAYDSNFESGTVGTKGGCVLVYLKQDGTIGKAITPTDVTPLYLTNTSHTNEEVVRTHNWREFGAGRSDDFSYFSSGSLTNLAFTLDDGVTTLVGNQVTLSATSGQNDVSIASNGSFVTLTFVGTGLDIIRQDHVAGGSDTYTLTIDGVAQGNMNSTGSLSIRNEKICSGLPYGTHTVKIARSTAVTYNLGIQQFIVYAPKKPSLPSGAIELAQYYRMADFIATGVATINFIGSGVIRKGTNAREGVYTGTWLTSIDTVSGGGFENGYNTSTVVSGSSISYSFWGTGFEWKGSVQIGVPNAVLTVDGSSNVSGFTTSFAQTSSGVTFTPSTGALGGSSAALNKIKVQVSGLSLGWHTLKWVSNTTVQFNNEVVDVITPIHAPTLNGPYVLQNTLALGNNNFLDLRKFNKKDIVLGSQSRVSQCVGVASAPTITTTNTPINDMSITHNCLTGRIRVIYDYSGTNTASTHLFIMIYVDGKQVGIQKTVTSPTGQNHSVSDSLIVNTSIGQHKIDIYAQTNTGTMTGYTTYRTILVEDV